MRRAEIAGLRPKAYEILQAMATETSGFRMKIKHCAVVQAGLLWAVNAPWLPCSTKPYRQNRAEGLELDGFFVEFSSIFVAAKAA
jgi:hypothetical protein